MTNAMKTATQQPNGASTPSPLIPHLAFWSVGLLAKILFPVSLKWLAYDSITTMLLSVWYPLCSTIALIHREDKLSRSTATDENARETTTESLQLQMERNFWIEYWSVGFAGVQFLHQIVSLVPSLQQMGRYDYPQLPVVLCEIKLLFFAWIFCMEPILDRYQKYLGMDTKERWKKFLPLTALTKVVGPRLMRVQMAISEQISRDTWQRVIHRKAQRVLELTVVLQFLEEESMAYLLQLLEEGRPLLLLSVFMVLPSSICKVGMLYAQFVFPSARSLAARGHPMEIMSLKYWVLNSVLTLFLSATWWLWWCIPFSSQLILGIRCFATFPSTIAHHYSNVEMELITFGILKGEPKLTVRETKTVQALRAVVKRLPRDRHASSFQFEIDDDDFGSQGSKPDNDDEESSVGSVDTTESEEERRRQRRREKRAKKRLLKEKKLAESMGSNGNTTSSSTRPPALLSESFIARYDDENDENAQKSNDFIDNDEKYSSFVNSNTTNCENKSDKNNVIDLTNYSVSEKEERDARNAAEIGYTTSAESNNTSLGSNYSSSQIHSKLSNVNVATPTETITGEVEVQVRPLTTESTKSRRTHAPLFPVTHPKSSGSNTTTPSASYEESSPDLKSSLSKAPQSSNDDDCGNDTDSGIISFSDVDLTTNESNESCDSSQEESNDGKNIANAEVDEEVISAPRRSSRLMQLREWQEQKRKEEEAKKSKKKTSKSKTLKEKPRPEGPREKATTKSPSKSGEKKAKKSTKSSTNDKAEKTSTTSSPKKSKKSKTPTKESTDASTDKKVKKKSSAASPDKSSKRSKKKGQAPLEPEGEGGTRSSSSSPQKTPKSKPKKIPNSQKKKKKKESSTGIGGLFGR